MTPSDRKARGFLSLKWPSMSKAVDGLIALIVGKGLIDKRDMARYERSLASAEARNSAVTQVVYESPPPPVETKNMYARTTSVPGTIPKEGSVRPPRPRPELPSPPVPYAAPIGAPDLSAADTPEEQDAKGNPKYEMKGFGRFRRSIHADAEWELKTFAADLQELGPAALQLLGDFDIAKLHDGVMDKIRTPSRTSLAHSDAEDVIGGPRICRGFDRSKSSVAVLSKRDGSCSTSGAESAAMSVTPTQDLYNKQQAASRCAGLAPLSTIDGRATTLSMKKKSVPLIFRDQGMVDQVIEDDEDCETREERGVTENKNNTKQGMLTDEVLRFKKRALVRRRAPKVLCVR